MGFNRDAINQGLLDIWFLEDAVTRRADKAIIDDSRTALEAHERLEKVHDPESQGSKQALMMKLLGYSIPAGSNPVDHLYATENLYSRAQSEGLTADTPFILAHFLDLVPSENHQPKIDL
ncbi:unnamed protein product, partial [Pylaiella littoralis]